MALVAPPPLLGRHPLLVLLDDLREERAAEVPFPPGETRASLHRTRRFAQEPLPMLLEAYERYGPVFTLRLFHSNVVFMLGPEANHYILVSHASNFLWREGHFRDLLGLMGDGLLTIDGDFHRLSRRIMLPAFHRERLETSVDTIVGETERALDGIETGAVLDVYAWTRRLAMRVAMRALFGLDPDRGRAAAIDAAALFEEALAFYSSDYFLRVFRGKRSPWGRMQVAARALDTMIYAEIAERRASGRRGSDILSLLLDAEDEDGNRLTDRHIRDEVMTLLFAGHDTTTSTVSFMLYELARNPHVARQLRGELHASCPDGVPEMRQLLDGSLPQLEMTVEETLRKYPPAWVGPRRAIESFELAGQSVPARAFVNYCSWASHHLPDVFAEPEVFRPERFSQEERAKLPKGAYVPFGGGSRTCIGMRFGQLEVRTITSMLASRFAVELPDGFELRIRQMPTISPRDGLPMTLTPAAR
jgi:cytochrome P450